MVLMRASYGSVMFSMTALARFSYLDLGSCKRCCIVEIIDDGAYHAPFSNLLALQLMQYIKLFPCYIIGHRQFVAQLMQYIKSIPKVRKCHFTICCRTCHNHHHTIFFVFFNTFDIFWTRSVVSTC